MLSIPIIDILVLDFDEVVRYSAIGQCDDRVSDLISEPAWEQFCPSNVVNAAGDNTTDQHQKQSYGFWTHVPKPAIEEEA